MSRRSKLVGIVLAIVLIPMMGQACPPEMPMPAPAPVPGPAGAVGPAGPVGPVGPAGASPFALVGSDAVLNGVVFADAFSSNSPLLLQTAGTTRILVDDVTGNVGIGQADPQAPLNLTGEPDVNATGGGALVIGDAVGANKTNLAFDNNEISRHVSDGAGVFGPGELFLNNNGGNVRLGNSGSVVRVPGTVRADGNVGIGTASPGFKLHVEGGSDAAPAGGGFAVFGSTTSVNVAIDNNEIMARNNGAASTLTLNNNGGNVNIITSGTGSVGIGGSPGSHKLRVANSTAFAEVIQFDSTVDLAAFEDFVSIEATAGSNDNMQFIECQRGADFEFRVWGDGEVTADGMFTGGGADFAELIRATDGALAVEAGDVMIIDVSNPRSVVISTAARSTLVAGIHSTKPGFLGTAHDWDQVQRDLVASGALNPSEAVSGEGLALRPKELGRMIDEIPLAIVGIVPVKVSAENGAIRPGDLLVTSSTPGHAMRDENPKPGTILGKALGSLDVGKGTIRVLVTLQ